MIPASTVDIKPLSIMKKKWKYRGEGNVNLVLALPEERVILRLHKISLGGRESSFIQDLESEEINRVCREAFFCRTVMVPLLGNAYIQPPTVGWVQHKEVHQLDNLLRPQRPNFRHHKGIRFGYVNIYPDYALLPEKLVQRGVSRPPLHTPVVCSSRGRCTRPRSNSPTHDCSLEDISRLSTTVVSVLRQKCINKSCVLSDPVLLNNGLWQMPSVNRKMSKGLNKYLDSQHALAIVEPTYCVEIKPKQGWIPRGQLHHPKCIFCLNQYLKISNGSVSRFSQYCPLDLFSGDELRMKQAIKNLLRTPQNNLKIFKNGELIYSEDGSESIIPVLQQWLEPSSCTSQSQRIRLIDSFCSLVYHALTANLLGDVDYPVVEDRFFPIICSTHCCSSIGMQLLERLKPCDFLSHPLPRNCILDRILCIQKLQQYDTETVHSMLWQYRGLDDYDYVTKLRDPRTGHLSMDPVQSYLLATTAKDCSILITFQRLKCTASNNMNSVPKQNVAVDVNSGVQYVFNIGVSDLDPKPLSCIIKHRKRDMDMIYACTSVPSAH